MKINVTNNSVLNNLSTMNQSHDTHKNTLIKTAILDNIKIKQSPAVKISISSEGIQKYRDSLGDKIQSESYESVVNQTKQLIQNRPKMLRSSICYMSEMHGKIESMAGGKTTKEIASDLLKSYASMYDEIMQDKNDDNEEFISEQINELNEALKNEASFLETQAQLAPKYITFYERLADDWESMGNYEKASKARSGLLRLKNDIVPENLYEKTMTASKLFVEQYSMQKNGSIDNILEKIFPTSKNKNSM